MKKLILLIIVLLFNVHFPLYSADSINKEYGSPGTYEISPILGAFVFEDRTYNNSLIIGVKSLINITKKYALEGEIGFSPSKFNYGILGGSLIKEENLKIYNYCCNFIYKYPLSQSVYSYGTFGMGGMSFIPETSNSSSDIYFNFGGGLRFSFGENMAFRLDIRQYAPSVDMQLFSPRSGSIYFSPNASPKAEVQKILQFNVGITFLFK